jgi:hypothetical protein
LGITLLKSLSRGIQVAIQAKHTLSLTLKARHLLLSEHRLEPRLKAGLKGKQGRLDIKGVSTLGQILLVIRLGVRGRGFGRFSH